VRIFPKKVSFSDRFESLSEKIREGGILFRELLDDADISVAKVSRLKEIEHEADYMTHGIYRDLHRTVMTPLDREDIHKLADQLDSILDMIESSAVKIQLYRIKAPVSQIGELAAILNKSIALLCKAIHAMRERKKNVQVVLALCVEINSLENEADHVLQQAMAQLFEREEDVIELIKCKEILERIEEATDICEDVSNTIEGIILKYS